MALSRESILNASPGAIVTVAVPEWGGSVCLRPLSGAEVAAIYGKRDASSQQIVQELVVQSICDESGTRLFEPADAAALFDKSQASLRPLVDMVLEINRMTKESAAAARKT